MDYSSWSVSNLALVFPFRNSEKFRAGIIIITTQILSLGLRKLRQPRVIAEVLGGILLGTTA
jgi:Kef-type K+ transport system membrane component KefB